MIPKSMPPQSDMTLIRGGNRFSDKIMRYQRDRASIPNQLELRL